MNREIIAILLIAASGILFFVIMAVVIVRLLKNREKPKPAGEDEKLFRRVSAAREIGAGPCKELRVPRGPPVSVPGGGGLC